jgi:hypothetical protein
MQPVATTSSKRRASFTPIHWCPLVCQSSVAVFSTSFLRAVSCVGLVFAFLAGLFFVFLAGLFFACLAELFFACFAAAVFAFSFSFGGASPHMAMSVPDMDPESTVATVVLPATLARLIRKLRRKKRRPGESEQW